MPDPHTDVDSQVSSYNRVLGKLKSIKQRNIQHFYCADASSITTEDGVELKTVNLLAEYIPGGSVHGVLHNFKSLNEHMIAIYV